jgi:hypothetical protein
VLSGWPPPLNTRRDGFGAIERDRRGWDIEPDPDPRLADTGDANAGLVVLEDEAEGDERGKAVASTSLA